MFKKLIIPILLCLLTGCSMHGPRLFIEDTFQLFDSGNNKKNIIIQNTGTEILEWSASTNQDWIKLENEAGTIAPGSFDELTIIVSKIMEEGNYGGLVTVISNGGTKELIINNDVPFTLEFEATKIAGKYGVNKVVWRGAKDITDFWEGFTIEINTDQSYTTTGTYSEKIWPEDGEWNFNVQGSLKSQELLRDDNIVVTYRQIEESVIYLKFNFTDERDIPEQESLTGLFEFHMFRIK